jgi:E3 ubiquitin ligase SMURF1/2/E3 ubiquitin-protein ligase NEDD4
MSGAASAEAAVVDGDGATGNALHRPAAAAAAAADDTTAVLDSDVAAVDALLNELEKEDLVAVAAMPFMEKQLWFLAQLDKLQVPYVLFVIYLRVSLPIYYCPPAFSDTMWHESNHHLIPSSITHQSTQDSHHFLPYRYRGGCIRMEIRREYLLLDTLVLVAGLNTRDMHKWWRMQFANEPGIDAGGLEREWFSLVSESLFDPTLGLFTSASMGGAYHINPTSAESKKEHLRYYKVAGRMFGKAVMEQQTVNAPLSLPLRKMLLNIPITFSDLEFCDPALYRSLLYLQRCPPDEVEMLCLDFTVAYPIVGAPSESGGTRMKTMELKPGGTDIAVTSENREEYLALMLSNRMLTSIQSQVEWLLRGFYEVVPPDLLSVFDYQELDLLLCGIPEISVEDWRRHTEYLGIYHENHRNIKWFWNFVDGCDAEERARLLQFITGASRLPPQGFKALISNDGNHRRFNIQSISRRESIYPRSHTCFNKLDLPLYSSQQELNAFVSCVLVESSGFTMD